MAEYIDRHKLKDSMCSKCRSNCKGEGDYCVAVHDVLDAPAMDVVAVVRCRDCIYASEPSEGKVFCDCTEVVMAEEDFCSWGERKSEE